MTEYFYDSPILPHRFKLPQDYIDFSISGTSQDLCPWMILSVDMATSLYYFGSMLLKFPNTSLVPFALISDESGIYNDGWVVLACFDGENFSGNPMVRIYDYSTPQISSWQNRSYDNFLDWLEADKKEAADYKLSIC